MKPYNEANQLHTEVHLGCENKTGGEQRATRGNLVEVMVADLWESVHPDCSTKRTQKHKIATDLKEGVDVDLYIKDKLVGQVECKAYLDKSMLKRAYVDFAALNTLFPESKNIIVSLERSTSEEVELALSKFMNTDIDIFYLVDGKRSSSKPMYNKLFFKDLSVDKYNALCKYFLSLYEKNS